MKKLKYVILGGGITGLSVAVSLLSKGETSFVVLEKEATAGGLCRSEYIEGGPVDIGGGHILDLKRKNVLDLVFSFLPKHDWECFERKTKIIVGNYEVGYPLESHLWQFPKDEQNKYLESISNACRQLGKPMPEKFTDWIVWNFGKKIAVDYLIPYNKKIWSCDLDTLGTYWLNKLPKVSYNEILESINKRKPLGKVPAHSNFYYPKKFGYGEFPLRMAKYLDGHIEHGYEVTELDWKNGLVNNDYQGKYIINTLPWQEISSSFPEEIKTHVDHLAYTSVDIDYYSENIKTEAETIYYADIDLPYHRQISRRAIRPKTNGNWTETNAKRRKDSGKYHFENKYAYPISTFDKPQAISAILKWAEKNGIIGVGRWGEWEHMNSDVAIEHAIILANSLLGNKYT